MWHNVRQLNMIASALYALVVLAVLGTGARWMSERPTFALHAIQIDGDTSHINALTVRQTVVDHLKGNFFTVNLETARAAFESMPWVRHASVRRVWPDTLAVDLDEYKPLGTWGDDRMVSVDGELFTANQAEADGELPAFDGPEGSEQDVVARYHDFATWFAPLHAKPVEVTLSPRYAWTVKLSNGLQVEFGRERNAQTLASRAQRFVSSWDQTTQRWGKDIEYADLRYPNGFAVRSASMQIADDDAAAKPAAAKAAAPAKPAAKPPGNTGNPVKTIGKPAHAAPKQQGVRQ
ncbi:cell division protein FtsQ/DivIB [Pararobbsia silviterrae]|uniref:Cell division protein FtsQ n=1 Tax=Pararobbsia silviterrae TaxID=1792498 RepID=A0A494XKA8_9BURK|nr:cell division protein FtsQ/DivIB [Pararobbsia silviterrae]RKP48514.1 cell division protein FtsQ/DivIB [Pararobbsia silviterrae]